MFVLDNRLGQNKNESPAMTIMSMLIKLSLCSARAILCYNIITLQQLFFLCVFFFALCWIYLAQLNLLYIIGSIFHLFTYFPNKMDIAWTAMDNNGRLHGQQPSVLSNKD